MAEPVVDPLEPVEVDQRDRARHIAVPRACNLFFEGMHDAAAVQRSRQFIELGELFDALVGLLQFQTSAVKRFLQGTPEQPDSHGTAKHQNENQQGCEKRSSGVSTGSPMGLSVSINSTVRPMAALVHPMMV